MVNNTENTLPDALLNHFLEPQKVYTFPDSGNKIYKTSSKNASLNDKAGIFVFTKCQYECNGIISLPTFIETNFVNSQ